MSLKSLLKTLAVAASLLALAAAGTQAAEKTASKAAPKAASAPGPNGGTGKVAECIDAANYTYVKVDFGGGKTSWVAAPQFKAKKGATVTVPQGMPMANFESKTLKRTFDVVYFVDHVEVKK